MDLRAERLVGRASELASAVTLLRAGQDVLFTGDAGVGKTRLLIESARALGDSTQVLPISGAESATSLPLGPLLRLCPPGTGEPGRAILAELHRRARKTPLVVLVDDAHGLDEASAAVARQLVAAEELTVALAIRDGEPLPPGMESVWRDGLAHRLHIEPLMRTDTDALVVELIGPADADLLDRVWAASQGHPLFVAEILHAALDDGSIAMADGSWRLDGTLRPSGLLEDVLTRRIAGLTVEQRETLALLAIGGDIRPEALVALDRDRPLHDLVRMRLAAHGNGVVRCSHPLHASAVLRSLGQHERARLPASLATAIASTSDDPFSDVVVARLQLRSGAAVPPDELRHAVQAALDSRLPGPAHELAQALLATGQPVDASDHLALAHALAMAGQLEDAEDAAQRAFEIADSDQTAPLRWRWARIVFEYHPDPAAAVGHVRAASDAVAADRDGHVGDLQLVADTLRARMFVEPLDPILASLQELLATGRLKGRAHRQVVVDAVTVSADSGPIEFGTSLADRALSGLDESRYPVACSRLRISAITGTAWLDGIEASAKAERFVTRALEHGDPDAETLALVAALIVATELGRHADAVSLARRATVVGRAATHVRHVPRLLSYHALSAASLRGHDATALVREATELPPGAQRVSGSLVMAARGMAQYREGGDPVPAWSAAIAEARDRGTRTHLATCLRLLAQVEPNADTLNLIDDVARRLGDGLATLIADEVHARAARDGHALHDVASRLAAFGASGHALDAAATAIGLLTDVDDLHTALRAELLSDALSEQLPNHLSPAVITQRRVRSDREREVTDLVVAGATNRQVADALTISHRTVERHLHRLYARCNLSGRRELRQMVDEATAFLHPVNSPEHPPPHSES